MFAFRHFRLLALAPLISCSVYTDSLLGDAQQTVSSGGAVASVAGKGSVTDNGASGHGGSATDPSSEDTAGDAHGSGETTAGSAGRAGAPPDGGASGSGSVGGSAAGNGGSAGSGVVNPPSGLDMLDDMEDGNAALLPKAPRYGYWYVAGDKTVGGKLSAIDKLMALVDPARDGSTSAVHFEASGFKDWGSSVGLSFTDAAQKRTPYDAGNAVGISFWVRGSIADNVKLKVQLPITATDPSGKLCGGAGQGQCLDHFSTQIVVTSQWTQVPIPFTALHQAGWGVPVEGGFDPSQMLGIEWSSGVANLDVWIDDLALLRP